MALVKRWRGQTESESKLSPLFTFIITVMASEAQLFTTLPSKTYVDAQKSGVKNDVSASTDISIKYP